MSNHNIRVDAIGLAAEVVELRNEIARLKNQTNWVCSCGGTDCEGQRENAALRELVGTLGAPNHINVPIEQWRELRADKERLDWLETQDCWIGVYGEYDINARICAGGSHSQRIRSAVDAARKEAQP